MLPGTLQLGDTLLIEGELCLANQQQVQHPTLRAIQASARLHAWDDRRLLAIWDPHVGCFVRVTTNATSPNAASAECMPLACGSQNGRVAPLGQVTGVISIQSTLVSEQIKHILEKYYEIVFR